MPLTRADIHSVLGEVDDHTAACIASTGANLDELEEAYHEVERGEEEGEAVPFSTNPRIVALRNFLEELTEWSEDGISAYPDS